MQRLIALLLVAMGLAACVTAPPRARVDVPVLQLAPVALGHEIAWQQRLVFSFEGRTERVDGLLEVDASEVRLVLHRLGQIALRLRWDGRSLEETRAPQLPDGLSADRILSDLQLVFWPLESVRAGLPAGWSVAEREGVRDLRQGEELVARIVRVSSRRATLHQHRFGYRLEVESEAVPP